MSNVKCEPTGKQIKKALIDHDMSQKELATELGCSLYYVKEICADTRKAVEMRARIGAYLSEKYKQARVPLPRWARASKGLEINKEFHEALGMSCGGEG